MFSAPIIIMIAVFGSIMVVALASGSGDHAVIPMIVAVVAIGFGLFVLLGCSKKKQDNDIDYKKQAQDKYTAGLKDVYKGSCITASDKFEKVSEIYPYSDLAKKSSIMQIYCEYIQQNYESAASLADLHEKFYPYDEYGDYVSYIRSLAFLNLVRGFKRDIRAIEDTENAINYLTNTYPTSNYKILIANQLLDIQKLKYLNDLEIAMFYINGNHFISAFKRLLEIKYKYSKFSFYESQKIDALYEKSFQNLFEYKL